LALDLSKRPSLPPDEQFTAADADSPRFPGPAAPPGQTECRVPAPLPVVVSRNKIIFLAQPVAQWSIQEQSMFVILSIVIYFAGRAIGWLALSLTMGRDAVFQQQTGPNVASTMWLVLSVGIAAIICFLKSDWGIALPI